MSKSRIVLTSFALLAFTLAGCSRSATKPGSESFGLQPAVAEDKRITSTSVVKAVPQPIEISAGSSGEVTVNLTIQNGYHINANPPSYPYLKATELEIAPGEGISVGSVAYPAPLNRKFPFAEKPLAVYEGETALKATLKAGESAVKGERSVSARLRIQACDDQVCYPPGTMDIAIPVSIK